VMDLCPCGDLADFGVDGHARLSADQVKFVGLEVTAVMCYLHSQLVMFRDLKPANLLLDDSGHVKASNPPLDALTRFLFSFLPSRLLLYSVPPLYLFQYHCPYC